MSKTARQKQRRRKKRLKQREEPSNPTLVTSP